MTLRPDIYADEDLDIHYNISDTHSWGRLVTALHTFLSGERKKYSSYLFKHNIKEAPVTALL